MEQELLNDKQLAAKKFSRLAFIFGLISLAGLICCFPVIPVIIGAAAAVCAATVIPIIFKRRKK